MLHHLDWTNPKSIPEMKVGDKPVNFEVFEMLKAKKSFRGTRKSPCKFSATFDFRSRGSFRDKLKSSMTAYGELELEDKRKIVETPKRV
jgi:hypothetical protein